MIFEILRLNLYLTKIHLMKKYIYLKKITYLKYLIFIKNKIKKQ